MIISQRLRLEEANHLAKLANAPQISRSPGPPRGIRFL